MSNADASAGGGDAAALSPHEAWALLVVAENPDITDAEIAEKSRLGQDQARSAAEFLRTKGAFTTAGEDQVQKAVALTEQGALVHEKGHPRARVLEVIRGADGIAPNDLRQRPEVDPAESGAALGWLKQRGIVTVGKDGLVRPSEKLTEQAKAGLAELDALAGLVARLAATGEALQPWDTLSPAEAAIVDAESKKRGKDRGPFRVAETKIRRYRATEAGRALLARARAVLEAAEREIAQLTSEHLREGSWRDRPFRRYSLGIKPARIVAGRRHPYREFLDRVRRQLVGLGFEEMTGSLVENEFWNMDALFMPQFHPARAIHDGYFIAQPTHAQKIEQPFLDNVAAAHENGFDTGSIGWRYAFDRERTRRLLMRTQGTALSARQLSKKPRIPGKYFGMARCFRPDVVDATHAPDFFQVEGIVLGEDIGFRHLLGLLKIFALEIAGSEEVRFAPTYFPFTEPSVEIHMRHPKLGWVELGGSGIFRPELTKPLGVDVPVIAWGLGLDRMAMVALGINDIRELFSGDLELIRSQRLRP